MDLIARDGTAQYRDTERPDATPPELARALVPVKSFRTRQRADFQIYEYTGGTK